MYSYLYTWCGLYTLHMEAWCMYIFKGGTSKGWKYFEDRYSDWDIYSYLAMVGCILLWKTRVAMQLTQIQFVIFLTLNFIIDFVIYEIIFEYEYPSCTVWISSPFTANTALREVNFLCGMILWMNVLLKTWILLTSPLWPTITYSWWSIHLRCIRDMDYTLHMEVWCMYIGRD